MASSSEEGSQDLLSRLLHQAQARPEACSPSFSVLVPPSLLPSSPILTSCHLPAVRPPDLPSLRAPRASTLHHYLRLEKALRPAMGSGELRGWWPSQENPVLVTCSRAHLTRPPRCHHPDCSWLVRLSGVLGWTASFLGALSTPDQLTEGPKLDPGRDP